MRVDGGSAVAVERERAHRRGERARKFGAEDEADGLAFKHDAAHALFADAEQDLKFAPVTERDEPFVFSARAAVAQPFSFARKFCLPEAVQRQRLPREGVLGAVVEAVLPALLPFGQKDALFTVEPEGKARRPRVKFVVPRIFPRLFVEEVEIAPRLFPAAMGVDRPSRRKVEREHAQGGIHGIGGKIVARIGARIVEEIVPVFEAAVLPA